MPDDRRDRQGGCFNPPWATYEDLRAVAAPETTTLGYPFAGRARPHQRPGNNGVSPSWICMSNAVSSAAVLA